MAIPFTTFLEKNRRLLSAGGLFLAGRRIERGTGLRLLLARGWARVDLANDRYRKFGFAVVGV